ncbi:MAG: sigma-54-dependent Fis family transcriptional regulator [Deltaproteobacteria bacterium]|nr:sigma-54-dependent Fis family transcriptional regulator [Deltaproteobacteria bacterium]
MPQGPRPIRVLVVDDEKLIRWSFKETLEPDGYEVLTAETAEEGLTLVEHEGPDVVFLDIRLPGMSGLEALKKLREIDDTCAVIMITAYATVDDAVVAMKQGARDFLKKPFDLNEVRALLARTVEEITLRREVERLQRHRPGPEPAGLSSVIGRSTEILQLLDMGATLARSDTTTVLIEGESGTGKGLLARAIHHASGRTQTPLVEINCTALPENLVESEIMGHERGAFTDAHSTKRGLLELADGGTVVLDEIGEIPLSVQVKLLRCIEEKCFRRVGGLRDLHVDVRIIATTNRDLQQAVREGRFREDLYFRLKVFPLLLPPLRRRRDDIPLLAVHFVEEMNKRLSRSLKGVSQSALQLMREYDWPGNVRELRNVIERGVLLASGDQILPGHLPAELRRTGDEPAPAGQSVSLPRGGVSLSAVEKHLIEEALAAAGGNQVRAARMLKISRDTLRYRMKKFGLA